jgi:Uma2 family endonuclease
MSVPATVPLSEYLGHTYDPDCEYIDGTIQERNVGEIDHSDAQGRTYLFVQTQIKGVWAGVEVRVQVKATRYRVPDVTIVRGGKPAGRVITTPPEVAVEILLPDDRASDIQDKIDDYLGFGVPCVWVIRPETRRAWVHTNESSREAKDGFLRNPAGDVVVPLAAIFPG